MDMLDQAIIELLDWLARVVRSNVLFGALVAAVVALAIGAAWWSLAS